MTGFIIIIVLFLGFSFYNIENKLDKIIELLEKEP